VNALPRYALLLGVLLWLPLAACAAQPATPAARIVAIGDVHGAATELRAILRRSGLIDDAGRWSGGNARLVSTGDLLDRGPDSRQVLDLLMRLEREAVAAGGSVQVLLGNHELMTLTGDVHDASAAEFAAFAADEDPAERAAAYARFVQVKREGTTPALMTLEFDQRFPQGWFARRRAFSAEGVYGRWLLGRPAAAVIDGTAFVHGGLTAETAKYDLPALNAAIRERVRAYLDAVVALERAKRLEFWQAPYERPAVLAVPVSPAGAPSATAGAVPPADPLAREVATVMAFGDDPLLNLTGPMWSRALAVCLPVVEEDALSAALAKLGATRVVIGHTVTAEQRIVSRYGGRVIEIDTGMLAAAYHGRPSALEITAGGMRALYSDDAPGTVGGAPAADPRLTGFALPELPDAKLEQMLAEAEVVEVLPGSVSGDAERDVIRLSYKGHELSAWFLPARSSGAGTSGSYRNELAAYRLDRMLGLRVVPVTIERELAGRKGALRWRSPQARDGAALAAQGLQGAPWCDLAPQYTVVGAFDWLIGQRARTDDSFQHTLADGLVESLEHRLAFGEDGQPSAAQRERPPQLGSELARRVKALERKALRAELGKLLKGKQVDAIVTRRDALLRAQVK
jgi:hypothetical protein